MADLKTVATVATPAPTEPDAPAPAVKPIIEPLLRGAARLFEFSSNVWSATAPAGVTAEELDAHPSFFSALADEVREGDELKVFCADRSWLASFTVVYSQPGSVVARLAYRVEGTRGLNLAGLKPIPEGYRILRTGPNDQLGDGWFVERERDGLKILNSGAPWKSYQDAYQDFLKHPIFQSDRPAQYFPG